MYVRTPHVACFRRAVHGVRFVSCLVWRCSRWASSLWRPACCSACWRPPATRSRVRTPLLWAPKPSTNRFFLDFAPPGFGWSNGPVVTTHQVLSAHSSMGPRNFIRLDGLFRPFRPMLRVLRCKIQTLSSASGLRNPPGSSWSIAAPDSFRRSPRQMELLEFNFCNSAPPYFGTTVKSMIFHPVNGGFPLGDSLKFEFFPRCTPKTMISPMEI